MLIDHNLSKKKENPEKRKREVILVIRARIFSCEIFTFMIIRRISFFRLLTNCVCVCMLSRKKKDGKTYENGKK